MKKDKDNVEMEKPIVEVNLDWQLSSIKKVGVMAPYSIGAKNHL